MDNPTNRSSSRHTKKYGTDAPVPTIGAQGAYGTLLLLQQAADDAGGIGVRSWRTPCRDDCRVTGGEITINPDNHVVEGPIRVLQVEGNGYKLIEEFDNVPHPNSPVVAQRTSRKEG